MSRIQHIPIAFMEKSGYNKQRREKEEIKKQWEQLSLEFKEWDD